MSAMGSLSEVGRAYSITSSAVASKVGGTVMPRVCAVLRLIDSSKRVGCITGMSRGCLQDNVAMMVRCGTSALSISSRGDLAESSTYDPQRLGHGHSWIGRRHRRRLHRRAHHLDRITSMQ
jgi:hypothetical protein